MSIRGRQFRSMLAACFVCALLAANSGFAQDSLDRFIQPRTTQGHAAVRRVQYDAPAVARPRLTQAAAPEYRATIKQHHSQLVTSDQKITRIAITAPDIVNFVQYSEMEVALIGLNVGSTDLTLWFENNPDPVRYEITVISGTPRASSPHAVLGEVAQKLRTIFSRSRVQLIPVADQVVVKGQAYDAAEAEQIMQITQAQFGGNGKTVVNMLRVPGEFQVMLRVRIAELNRTQLRKLGVTCRDLLKRSRKAKSFGPTTAGISGVFETREVGEMMRWLSSNGTISYLAEPSLTVLSGHSASFLSGGEYAVPTVIKDGEKHTEFRNYGTKLKVTPTVLDRDLIRLNVAPEFSQIDEKTTVDGVPGTNVRRVETVVELREGQTIAIGGLVSRQIQSQVSRKPGLRPKWFTRQATEADTELLIVVTPEIVRPMDPSDVPPMPNYYVTPPSDAELFGAGRSEGQPQPHRESGVQFGADQLPASAGVSYGYPIHMESAFPSGLPQSVLPTDSFGTGSQYSVETASPLSPLTGGTPLFSLPSAPNPPSRRGLLQPPRIPPVGRDNSRPIHVYPESSSPADFSPPELPLDGFETPAPTTSSLTKPLSIVPAKPKHPQAVLPIDAGQFDAGHSFPAAASQPPEKLFPNSTKGAVIRPTGRQRPVGELPPIGHSMPSKRTSRGQ